MFLVGTLAAVSATIGGYPLYGGQAVRYAGAAVVLFAVAYLSGQRPVRLTLRETGYALALALVGLVLFNVFVIEGTRHAGPATVGTFVAMSPVLMAVLGPVAARLTGGERTRISPRVVAGAAVVAGGALVATGFSGGNLAGVLFSLGALVCEAGFSLLALPLLPKLGALRVSAYASALAVPMLLVIGYAVDGTGVLRPMTGTEALSFAYLSLIVSVGAFLLWYSALPRLGADRAGLFAGVIPIGAIVASPLLGLGLPSVPELAGAALVTAGVLLGLRPPRRTAPAPAPAPGPAPAPAPVPAPVPAPTPAPAHAAVCEPRSEPTSAR
ncbi:DMT family transporter [Bailinhaonella thermotolerans]|uniref:DMT family transporter n=2 Tax=Bailinhaonella thermotolerans TaxID=1070861 RepID=A0A3A4B5L4_9ACTN|nr:DMT family transporter [Bailinhaonella thermotolerans]